MCSHNHDQSIDEFAYLFIRDLESDTTNKGNAGQTIVTNLLGNSSNLNMDDGAYFNITLKWADVRLQNVESFSPSSHNSDRRLCAVDKFVGSRRAGSFEG